MMWCCGPAGVQWQGHSEAAGPELDHQLRGQHDWGEYYYRLDVWGSGLPVPATWPSQDGHA